MFKGLDHLAIVVADTDEALRVWRDRFGLAVLRSETVNNDTTLLTHLELGNTQLQLVQPLTTDHPLWKWLDRNGAGLHHLCLVVDDVNAAAEQLPARMLAPGEEQPHQGTQGKRALFLDTTTTGGVQVELTGQ